MTEMSNDKTKYRKQRVPVWSGNSKKFLGWGNVVGEESIKIAPGKKLGKTPVINLDSGRVIHGYECGWMPAKVGLFIPIRKDWAQTPSFTNLWGGLPASSPHLLDF
jgi:hypothetical protein